MLAPQESSTEVAALALWVREARQRSLDLVSDLDDAQLIGPRLPIVNPLLWEIGHLAWFQEKWVLRHAEGQPPLRADGDALWDSAAIPHDARWDLPVPTRSETFSYMAAVRDRVLERLAGPRPSPKLLYFARYTVFHEDMHGEAFAYARQTLSYPPPAFARRDGGGGGAVRGDVEVPGGTFLLGAGREEPFVFDNEKWAHPVEVRPFAVARAPVTQAEFAAFVEEGGYGRPELWSREGWIWREGAQAEHPVYWRREGPGRWRRRHFDRWLPLEPDRPVIHVNWHEADAYCRWAGRRLPSESEWEAAASLEPGPGGTLSPRKRRFPWGDQPPGPERANLDGQEGGCLEVGALPAGDSAFGCRQMLGNVWEWTSTAFQPYPGFQPDAYAEYSQPWFWTHRVLRGGCWVTRARLLRNTWRNYYPPHRRDVWAGFRTCAPDG